jgi:glyoxylase-like metal-dependent hydrolase (beta-lactamase superfamily II)
MKLNDETGTEPLKPEQVRRGLIRVPLKTRTLAPATRTNCYLVHDGGGWLIVDFGAAEAGAFSLLDEAVRAFCKGWKQVHGLVLTHHHHDHTDGVARWLAGFKEPVLAHPATFSHLGKAVPRSRAMEIGEGDRLGDLEILHTPGHASGHLCLATGTGDLVCGDLIAGIGTIVIDPPDGSMGAYIASIDRIMARGFETGFPAHGPASPGLSRRLLSYRNHRMARDAKILAALGELGEAGLEAITAHAYGDVPAAALPVASRSALAHLLWAVERGLARPVGSDGETFAAVG